VTVPSPPTADLETAPETCAPNLGRRRAAPSLEAALVRLVVARLFPDAKDRRELVERELPTGTGDGDARFVAAAASSRGADGSFPMLSLPSTRHRVASAPADERSPRPKHRTHSRHFLEVTPDEASRHGRVYEPREVAGVAGGLTDANARIAASRPDSIT